MRTLLRFDSRNISVDNSNSNNSGKFQADSVLVSHLRAIPCPADDLKPPPGSLESGAVTYVLLSSDALRQRKCTCGGLKHSGLAPPRAVGHLQESNGEKTVAAAAAAADMCPRCVLPSAQDSVGDIVGYCQFAFVNTTIAAAAASLSWSEAYLVSVVIAAQFRRRGLCADMLQLAFDDLTKSTPSLKRIKLHARSDGAFKFLSEMYRTRFGFTVRRNCRNYYPQQKIDAVEMVKEVVVNAVAHDADEDDKRRRQRED